MAQNEGALYRFEEILVTSLMYILELRLEKKSFHVFSIGNQKFTFNMI